MVKCCYPLHYADVAETFALLACNPRIQLIASCKRNLSEESCLEQCSYLKLSIGRENVLPLYRPSDS